ncbi:unnamed protein product, partial [Vitis vinifera]
MVKLSPKRVNLRRVDSPPPPCESPTPLRELGRHTSSVLNSIFLFREKSSLDG